MDLQELFPPGQIVLRFDPGNKWNAIDRLLEHLKEVGKIDEGAQPQLREEVLARERSMSTGMERGLAIPHAAVDGIDEVVACLGVCSGEEPINFESIDATPTRFVVLLLIPKSQKLVHIRTLANIARLLGQEPVQRSLLEAASGEEASAVLGSGESQR